MLRISVSHLESFRRVVDTDYGDAAELAASIKGVPFEASWQMNGGSDWHEAISGAKDRRVRQMRYTFNPKDVDFARNHIGPGLWEVKATRQYRIGMDTVNLVAQVDHIYGNVIQDNKTKFSNIDVKDYQYSLQWRLYLAITGAVKFQYNLWDMGNPKSGHCELYGLQSVCFWTYPEIDRDCLAWVSRFADWTKAHDLDRYLVREGSSVTAEAAA